MGLDMYLDKKAMLYPSWNKKDEVEAEVTYKEKATGEVLFSAPIDVENTITLKRAYWRKANAIHAWFVKHVQDGEDDCMDYEVTEDQLKKLKRTCQAVLKLKEQGLDSDARELAEEVLPPQSGFFFGNTDIDDFYYGDLLDTVQMIDELLDTPDITQEDDSLVKVYTMYQYRASW